MIWYVGFGLNIVIIVYVGFDDNKCVLGKGELGVWIVMLVWRDYMKVVFVDKKDCILLILINIVEVKIDVISGFLGS